MALFESYERRIDKINSVLNSYGIASIEEAEKITKDGKASKKGLALSIPVGAGIMATTWDIPQKAVEKATRAVDNGAYAYQDSKNQQV